MNTSIFFFLNEHKPKEGEHQNNNNNNEKYGNDK